jgi:hypothetical protein
MSFDLKTGLFPYLNQLVIRNANLHIHYAVTFPAREVMVVLIPAGPVSMAPIRKIDPVQQSHVDKHLNRPEDSRAPQTRICLLQIVPQVLHAEILPAGGQFGQPGCDPVPGLRFPTPLLFEGGPDFFR